MTCQLLGFKFVAETGEGADPEHSDGAWGAVHAAGDFVVGEVLEVAEEDDFAVIVGEAGECFGEAELVFEAGGAALGEEAGEARISERRREESSRDCSREISRFRSRSWVPA